MIRLNRRAFTLGTASVLLSSGLVGPTRAQETRSVTTIYGTYDIPVTPRRVVAIDSRLDFQPALALGLPVVGHGHSVPGSWVPMPEGVEFFGSEVNIEQVLAAEPDLIICAAYDPDSPYWPANRLREIAPVVPTATDKPWKEALRELAALLGMEGEGETAFAEYDALVADIQARHADKIASRTIASVQPGDGPVYLMTGARMLQPQVLADIGARTVAPEPGQNYDLEVTPEAFGDRLGEVDGLIIVNFAADSLNAISSDPLWQRLPAVASDTMVLSNGNINYGSIYSAIYLAHLVDDLYTKMA